MRHRALSGCGRIPVRVELSLLALSRRHGFGVQGVCRHRARQARAPDGVDSLLVFGQEDLNNTRCGACGSLLFSVVRDGAYVHVAMGSLVDSPSIRPTEHIFVGSKAPWFEITDSLRLGRAALTNELHGPVQVGLASSQPLRERERIPGFHQHVQPPALDLGLVAAVRLDDLGRLSHDVIRSPSHRRTLLDFVCRESLREAALGARKRLIQALCQLPQPGLEDRSLCLRIGRQRVQATAKFLFGLKQP